MIENFLQSLQTRSQAFAERSMAARGQIQKASYSGGRGFRGSTFQLNDSGDLEPTSSGYGFHGWWRGRDEFGAGGPQSDWLQLDRPAIEEGSGPIAPLGGRAARRFGERQAREAGAQQRQGMVGPAEPHGPEQSSAIVPVAGHDLTNVREAPRRGAESPGTQFTPERLGIGGRRLPTNVIEGTVRDQPPRIGF